MDFQVEENRIYLINTSYIAYKMQRYLSWLGYTAKVFSVGDVREENPEYINVPIEYYDPDNEKVLIYYFIVC